MWTIHTFEEKRGNKIQQQLQVRRTRHPRMGRKNWWLNSVTPFGFWFVWFQMCKKNDKGQNKRHLTDESRVKSTLQHFDKLNSWMTSFSHPVSVFMDQTQNVSNCEGVLPVLKNWQPVSRNNTVPVLLSGVQRRTHNLYGVILATQTNPVCEAPWI